MSRVIRIDKTNYVLYNARVNFNILNFLDWEESNNWVYGGYVIKYIGDSVIGIFPAGLWFREGLFKFYYVLKN